MIQKKTVYDLWFDIHLGCASICGGLVSISGRSASTVSLGEAQNGFIFEIKFWLRVWSQLCLFWSLWQVIPDWLVLEATGWEQRELSLLCCGSTSMIPAAKL